MYKTAWQTKEETSARLHSPKSTHVNPEQAQQGYYQMTPDYLLKLAPGDCSPFQFLPLREVKIATKLILKISSFNYQK